MKNLRDIAHEIPNVCGNCVNNLWAESGCHCKKGAEADGILFPDIDDHLDYPVDWHDTCDLHERGEPDCY